jgi:hypothetical protein
MPYVRIEDHSPYTARATCLTDDTLELGYTLLETDLIIFCLDPKEVNMSSWIRAIMGQALYL